MTAILIDRYKHEVFVFADGRITKGDIVLTNTAEKVFRLDSDTIWTGCGDMRLDEQFKQLLEQNLLNLSNLDKLVFDGTFYIVRGDEITVVACEEESGLEDSKSGMYKLYLEALPIADGSGHEMLMGAYDALQPNKAKSRQEYIDRVKQCFNLGCKRVSSVGELYSYMTIRVKD